MVSHMKDEYKIKWEEAERELQEIKQWIDSGRYKFDSKTRYLISYAVIKARKEYKMMDRALRLI